MFKREPIRKRESYSIPLTLNLSPKKSRTKPPARNLSPVALGEKKNPPFYASGEFLKTLEDPDLNVRRVALVAFNSAAHNKPSLIRVTHAQTYNT